MPSSITSPPESETRTEGGAVLSAPVDVLEHLAVLALLCWAWVSIGGLALGMLGWFSWLTLALIAFYALINILSISILFSHLLGVPALPRYIPLGTVAALGLLLALFGAAVWPPAEFILGGWDAGAYVTTGAALARTGSFFQPDPFLAAAGPAAQAAVIADHTPLPPYLFPGFAFSPDAATIIPQFGMLLSLWVGVGVLLGGAAGGLAVAPLVGMLALALFFLLVRRAWGTPVGLAAALLLATNGVQVWHAQQTLSEELVQVFLFGGLLAGTLARSRPHPLYAGTAGLLLAMLPLVKTEALVLAPLALGAVGLALARPHSLTSFVTRDEGTPRSPGRGAGPGERGLPQPALFPFAAGAVLGGVVSLIHYATTARLYAWEQVQTAPGYLALAGAVLLLGLGVAGAVGRARMVRSWFDRLTTSGPLPAALALLLTVPVGWAALEGAALAPPPADLLRALYLGSFLSWGDVAVLGLCGLAFLLWRPSLHLRGDRLAILAVLALSSVLYLAVYAYYVTAQDRIPLYLWSTRRLLPTVVPLLAVLEALALARVLRGLPGGRGPLLLAAAGLLALGHLPALRPLLEHREYRGALEQVAALNARLPAGAVVLLDPDATGIRLGAPLRFLYGRESYLLWGEQEEQVRAGLAVLRERAAAQDRPVWYISSAPGPKASLVLEGGAQVEGTVHLALPELVRTSAARPRSSGLFQADLTLFRLVPGAPPAALQVRVDVGTEDAVAYALLRDGWYGRESAADGTSYRWTGPTATLALPDGLAGAASVRLRLGAGSRTAGAPAPRTVVACGAQEVAVLEPKPEFADYTLSLPAACAVGARTLQVRSVPWSPGAFGGADRRLLGVQVDAVIFAAGQAERDRP
ncbi:MAG: hypothetical protein HY689_01705 [Chloroflexi bacterium]|nr:hypothetical protein [Chloroflexota bacterium]